jgi:hypothetical protein
MPLKSSVSVEGAGAKSVKIRWRLECTDIDGIIAKFKVTLFFNLFRVIKYEERTLRNTFLSCFSYILTF